MKSDQMAERIAKRYLTNVGHTASSSASTDWISIATEIGSVLIPIIKDCIEKRRSAKNVAEFTKRRPLLARIQIRDAVSKQGVALHDRRAAVNAVMDEIDSNTADDLTAALQEVADDA